MIRIPQILFLSICLALAAHSIRSQAASTPAALEEGIFLPDKISGPSAEYYTPYSGNMAAYLSHPSTDALVYTKISGPNWLKIHSDGILAGAPTEDDAGTNSFLVRVQNQNGDFDEMTFELSVIEPELTLIDILADDFSNGSAALGNLNQWSDLSGPEDKEYNLNNSSQLILHDRISDEKGNGPHDGFFDTLQGSLPNPIDLTQEGSWLELSMEFDVFSGNYFGSTIADVTDGLRISLVDSNKPTDSGWGFFVGTGSQSIHSYREMRGLVSSQAKIGDALTNVNISENAPLKRLKIRLTRVANGIELSGHLDEHSLATVLSDNNALLENRINTLAISVAKYDHGVRVDNVEVRAFSQNRNTSDLWKQYVAAKVDETENTLPNFSYAGYRHGAEPPPTVAWPVYDVTAYGAVANDGLSDKKAIRNAIAQAEANGSGIIFFPPGRFDINSPGESTPWVNDPIIIEGSHIVFRGSGSGEGGTGLFAERHMNLSDENKLWSAPRIIQFKGFGDRPGVQTAVVGNSERETYSVTVANANSFEANDWIILQRQDASSDAVAEAVAPYTVDPSWTKLINEGVRVAEIHQIATIDGNIITFVEPIHSDISASGNWSVILFDPLVEVGVEDIAFVGNWLDTFIHHDASDRDSSGRIISDDSAWSALSFSNCVNGWIRRCRFKDWCACVSFGWCANMTAIDLTIEGNKGHNALTFANSTHCLAAMVKDYANHHHSSGVANLSNACVFWRSEYSPHSCFESHASQPRNTLFDQVSGGLIYGRSGGARDNKPNHMENMILWNFSNTGDGEGDPFQFFRTNGLQFIRPYVIGHHGHPQAFQTSMLAGLESNGAPVYPESLYNAQLKVRTGISYPYVIFREWATGHELDAPQSELQRDPDYDGRVNLVEYATGGDPTKGSIADTTLTYSISDQNEGTIVSFTYQRLRDAEQRGLNYSIEYSDSLESASWTSALVQEVDVVPVDDSYEYVECQLPASSRVFVRLRIELE
ncbi:MAG: DUF4955 domain-containing protein [Verrucomicrobiota bacterium]